MPPRKKVAVILFGIITRSLPHTWESFVDKIINPLISEGHDVKVYYHSWLYDKLEPSIRTEEGGEEMDLSCLSLLNKIPCPVMGNLEFQDDLAEYEDIINKTKLTFGVSQEDKLLTGKNIIRGARSMKKAFDIVDSDTDTVIFARPDVKFLNELEVKNVVGKTDLFLADFAENRGVNDRFAVGTYNLAKIYCNREKSILDWISGKDFLDTKNKIILNTEIFLKEYLERHQIYPKETYMRFRRIRASGNVSYSDVNLNLKKINVKNFKTTIYSCITGNLDDLDFILNSGVESSENLDCILYTDAVKKPVTKEGWKILPLVTKFKSPRKTARWHKLHSHILFPDSDYVIWADGTQQFIQGFKFSDMLKYLLDENSNKKYDIVTFKHPNRVCIYEEAEECKLLFKDIPEVMDMQVKGYRKENYPVNNGLSETSCIIRTNSNKIKMLNSLWWAEVGEKSIRDQLSLNYCAWKLKIPIGLMPGRNCNCSYFKFSHHINKTVDNEYYKVISTKSDISEHLEKLKKYADRCDHITEFGVRYGNSTIALMASRPQKMISYDVNFPAKQSLLKDITKNSKINWKFKRQSSLKCNIEKTDLLFIDTYHSYEQLSLELDRHSSKVKKYIIIHDTTTFGYKDEENTKPRSPKSGLVPAIDKFLKNNKDWARESVDYFNNGMTYLVKIS